MVHRRTENQSQRCAGHPLHAATQQIHLHQRHAAHRKHRGPPVGAERGHRFYPQRRSAHQTCSEQRKQNRLPAEQPFRPARKQGQRDRLGHRQGSRPRPDGGYDLHGTAQTGDRQERDDAARHAGPFRLEASDPFHTGLHVAIARAARLPPVRRLHLPAGTDLHAVQERTGDRACRSGLRNAVADRNIPLRKPERSPNLRRPHHPTYPERLESPRILRPCSQGVCFPWGFDTGDPAARHGARKTAAPTDPLHRRQHPPLHRRLLHGRCPGQGRRPADELCPQPDAVYRLLPRFPRHSGRYGHADTHRQDAIARPALLSGGLHGTPRRAGPAQRLLPHAGHL